MPYVAYLDEYGLPSDTFFDTFIFLGLVSPSGRHFAGEMDQEKAALYADWEWYLNRIFTPRKHLDALDTAVERVAAQLGLEGHKVNVYVMISYPSYLVTDFGTPGTEGDSLLPLENRLREIRWYVDSVIERWEALAPQHLRLAGFYWLQEHVNPAVPDELDMVRRTARYIHDLGLKLGWIPWSGAYLATQWRSFGFDWAVT